MPDVFLRFIILHIVAQCERFEMQLFNNRLFIRLLNQQSPGALDVGQGYGLHLGLGAALGGGCFLDVRP